MPKIIKDISFGALVLSPTNSVLLIKQLSQNGSYWALPKGHKEIGETDEEAAIREVNEECGLSLTTENLVPGVWFEEHYMFKAGLYRNDWERHSMYPNNKRKPTVLYDKKVLYGIALVNSELPVKPQAGEVEEVGWFSIDEAIKKLPHESQKNTVLALYKTRLV
jgi:ADP-ribose pyrophosphatase YjhB (NUDIX family)